jgi:3'-5' exoribonuclease
MFQRLVKITESLTTPYLKKLFDAFWKDKEFVRKFKTAPAAKKMHHAYIGGLLEHTLSMTSLADKVAGHYSGIDRDLLVSGAVLHDIGKIDEFEYQFKIDYTDEGRLLNHIVIGIKMVDEKLSGIEDFPEDRIFLLKHMMVSHHGAREFGSPEPPKTIEAVLLNYIDEIDSKVNGIRDFMAAEDPNETWTSYHRLLGRQFYKGKESA